MSCGNPSEQSASRSVTVDTWRAGACIAVVMCHVVQTQPEGSHPAVSAVVQTGALGWLGVPVFFVLSGYCLAESIERHAARGSSAAYFWGDRLLRIYPTYLAALIATVAVSALATPFNGRQLAGVFPQSFIALFGDLSLTSVWLGTPARLSVSWSLNYEIGFYLLIGCCLLFRSLSPHGRLFWLGALTAFSLSPAVTDSIPLLGMWPQFACGIGVHAASNKSLALYWRLIVFVALAAGGVWALMQSGWLAAFPAFAALGLYGSLHLPFAARILPSVIPKIGVASFSIYLVHFPFIQPVSNLINRWFPAGEFVHLAIMPMLLVTAILVGCVFHRCVELKFERLRKALRPLGADPVAAPRFRRVEQNIPPAIQ